MVPNVGNDEGLLLGKGRKAYEEDLKPMNGCQCSISLYYTA